MCMKQLLTFELCGGCRQKVVNWCYFGVRSLCFSVLRFASKSWFQSAWSTSLPDRGCCCRWCLQYQLYPSQGKPQLKKTSVLAGVSRKMCHAVFILWGQVGKRKRCSSTCLVNRGWGQGGGGDISCLFFPASCLAVEVPNTWERKSSSLDLIWSLAVPACLGRHWQPWCILTAKLNMNCNYHWYSLLAVLHDRDWPQGQWNADILGDGSERC